MEGNDKLMTSNGYNVKAITNITDEISAAATTIYIPEGEYKNFLPDTGDYVYLVLRNATYHEIIKVDVSASSAADGLSVSRNIGGTNRAWSRGTAIFQVIVAEDLENFLQYGGERQIDYDPNDVLTPSYLGEKVIQTGLSPCQNKCWMARDGVNKVWDIVAGVECGGTVSDPVLDPAGGSYGEAQTVTMTCATDGASIYYTTDGSTPDETDTLYTTSISVSTTTTIKARAFKENWVYSNVTTEAYTINLAETIEAETSDGSVRKFDASWATARNALTGDGISNDTQQISINSNYYGGYHPWR